MNTPKREEIAALLKNKLPEGYTWRFIPGPRGNKKVRIFGVHGTWAAPILPASGYTAAQVAETLDRQIAAISAEAKKRAAHIAERKAEKEAAEKAREKAVERRRAQAAAFIERESVPEAFVRDDGSIFLRVQAAAINLEPKENGQWSLTVELTQPDAGADYVADVIKVLRGLP